jgi:UDP-N-acetylmuramate-alanine ligase
MTDLPAAGINTIAVTGSSGKTTVSWLVRGMLEQVGQLTGMIGSIEHALAEHLLTPEGTLWMADETDPAAGRECSSPFALVPFQGRYLVEETTPNALQMQVCHTAGQGVRGSP